MENKLPNEVATILAQPRETWGTAEWAIYARFLEQSLTIANSGWGTAIEHADYFASLTKDLAQQLSQIGRGYARLFDNLHWLERRTTPLAKRTRGRPRKYGNAEQSEFLRMWEEIIVSERKKAKRNLSELAAIKSFFRAMYKQSGLRESRVDSEKTLGQIHTLQNQISIARASRK